MSAGRFPEGFFWGTAAAAQPAGDWKEYPYPKLNFAIQFPAAPEESNQTVRSPAGPVDLHQFGPYGAQHG